MGLNMASKDHIVDFIVSGVWEAEISMSSSSSAGEMN